MAVISPDNPPHLILEGDYAYSWAKEWLAGRDNVLTMDAVWDGNARDPAKALSRLSDGQIVVVRNADYLTLPTQQAFRRIMEQGQRSVRWVFCMPQGGSLIHALESRSLKLFAGVPEMARVLRMPRAISVFTDGSCVGPPSDRKAGWAWMAGDRSGSGRVSGLQTSQRAELTALHEAFKAHAGVPDIVFHSDSVYARKCLTVWAEAWKKNGFKTSAKKPVLNVDIIQPALEIIDVNPTWVIKWVRSHTGRDDGNDKVDKLARAAAV